MCAPAQQAPAKLLAPGNPRSPHRHDVCCMTGTSLSHVGPEKWPFDAPLFTVAETWKLPEHIQDTTRCGSCGAHTAECDSATAATRMDLETVTQSETSQTENTKSRRTSLTGGT